MVTLQLREAAVEPAFTAETAGATLVRVSASARRVVEVASFLGQAFAFDHVAAMLEVSAASLLGPLEELVHAGLLADAGTRLAFPDPCVRQAVIETVPRSARPALQRQAIDVLVEAGASPVEPAAHLARNAQTGDRAAIATLFTASRALGASDPGAAADLSRRAFELTAAGDDLRGPLVAETALLLHAADRAQDAKEFAEAALSGPLAPGVEAEVRMSLARMTALSPQARIDAGRAALELPGLPGAVRARHLSRLLDNVIDAGRPELARELLPEAQHAIGASGDPTAMLGLRVANARLAYVDDDFGEGLRAMDATLGVLDDADPRVDVALLWRADLLLATDQFDAAQHAAVQGSSAARTSRHAYTERSWQQLQGRLLLQAGRISEAAATLDGTVTASEGSPVSNPADAAALLALGRAALHSGDERAARACAARAEVALEDETLEVRRQAAWYLALHALAEGDAAAAHAHLTRDEATADEAVIPVLMVDVTDPPWLVRVARAADDDHLAHAAAAVAAHRLEHNPDVASIVAADAHARGLLTGDTAAFADAAQLLDGGPRLLACASAHEDFGLSLVRADDRERGIEQLGYALELYANAGATWDAARARRRLRKLGVRRRLVKPARPTVGWAGLTDAEVGVVRLVAVGLKNREVAERLFVSPHTVSMHLRHAFTKLDINSRVELTRFVFAHEEAA